jgi:hypothetical protein
MMGRAHLSATTNGERAPICLGTSSSRSLAARVARARVGCWKGCAAQQATMAARWAGLCVIGKAGAWGGG